MVATKQVRVLKEMEISLEANLNLRGDRKARSRPFEQRGRFTTSTNRTHFVSPFIFKI